MPTPPSKESIDRLSVAAESYRSAFQEVQRALAGAPPGSVPSWVFAVDRLVGDELRTLPENIRRTELKRRQARAALCALIELVALEDDGTHGPAGSPDGAEQADLAKLDRFITVTNGAREQGCFYVNGMFEPMGREAMTDAADTFDLGPSRRGGGDD
jgi:hypothetical protein